MRRLLLKLALCGPLCPVGAAPDVLTVYSTDLPPLVRAQGAEMTGLYAELLQEVARRAGLQLHWKILPWPRAQLEAQQDVRGLILPLTRTAQRESLYRWLAPIGWGWYAVLQRRDQAVSRLDELADSPIGYLLGSDAADVLLAHGLRRPEAANSAAANANKLKLGRIKAWAVSVWTGPSAYAAAGHDPAELSALALGRPWVQWLAAHPQFDPVLGERLSRALAEIDRQGRLQELEKAHWQRVQGQLPWAQWQPNRP